MKKFFLNSNIFLLRLFYVFIFSIILVSARVGDAFAQGLYNGGADITIVPGTIFYVDGDITNNASGFIHNAGDLYLTGNWNNDEPSGCLDPSSGNVILYGNAQSINGTKPTTFNSLDCQGAGDKTLNINTIVGGSTGALLLNANVFNLNSKTLSITNPSPSAITRSSGYIISETDPSIAYGKIQWDLGNSSNNYTFPFGTLAGIYIPLIYNITSPGIQNAVGNVSVATYPTDVSLSPNNRPLPSGVSNLNDASGTESASFCADRYWDILLTDYSTNPVASITFSYDDLDWDISGGSLNNIVEEQLKAWKWNGTEWQNPTIGLVNAIAKTVSVTDINTSSPWTLNAGVPIKEPCKYYEVPNAFSPNNDGHSDLFILHGWANCTTTFSFNIYNRWGEKVFESQNPAQSWDGTYKGQPLNTGVFVYAINAIALSGEPILKKGNISLIR